MVAAREAWADAGTPEVDHDRLGAIVGTGIGGAVTLLDQDDLLENDGLRKVAVLTIPMLMPNGPAAAVGLWVGARGGVHAPVSACAVRRGGHGLGLHHDQGRRTGHRPGRWHRSGHPSAAGGRLRSDAGHEHPQRRPGHRLAALRSRTGTDSSSARAPESWCSNAARTPWRAAPASTAPWPVSACPTTRTTSPRPSRNGEGGTRAIAKALRSAGLTKTDIGHVNAHATSHSGRRHRGEPSTILRAIGDHPVVTATKSMTGHMLGASGAVEAIATLLSVADGHRSGHHQRLRSRPEDRGRRGHRDPKVELTRRSTTPSVSAATTWRSSSPSESVRFEPASLDRTDPS